MHHFFSEHFLLFSSFSSMNGCREHRKPCMCKVPSECVLLSWSWPFQGPRRKRGGVLPALPLCQGEAHREVAKSSSGFCVGVDSVCRICLPQLSPFQYAPSEDCLHAETAPTYISQPVSLIYLCAINSASLCI